MIERLRLSSGYWFMSTPYSAFPGGYDAAFETASIIAAKLLIKGVHAFCPITHTHPISKLGHIDPLRYEIFMPLVEQFMHNAHGQLIVQMPGWDRSTGIQMEIEWFTNAGRPKVALDPNDL